jgi:cyclophilin family peptidyl-prolyl cis-trans isomerase
MKRISLVLALAGCSAASHATSPDLSQNLDVDMTAPYQIPAGYTLTPFLSDAPVRSFTAAGTATQPGIDYQAVMETDAGIITIDLDETDTPITVNSFVWLALHHFFDGLAFHRVIDGFVAQGGDPNTAGDDRSTWGTGDPGYSFGLEIVASLTYDGPGVLGMARSTDPNSNGSQFFITLAAAHSLDGMYTIFGKVGGGLDVLPNIARGEPPATPTRMQRVYIVQK